MAVTNLADKEPNILIAHGYDNVADAYAELEGSVEWPRMRWLRRVLAELSPGSRVLDLGCGSGVPATLAIAQEHDVVGVDVSSRQIGLARHNVPGAEFIQSDIQSLDFPPDSFDAVVAFYVLDHVPRELHAEVLASIQRWLKPEGLLLLTVETDDNPGELRRWLGVDMYFSSFDADGSRRLVEQAGLQVLADAIETQIEGTKEVPFLWVLARCPD